MIMSKDDDIVHTPNNNRLVTGSTNTTLRTKNLPSFEVNTKECLRNTHISSLHATKVSVPSFGVSYHNIQPSYGLSVLRADQNVDFSHNASLKKLSSLTPKLQCLKQDYDYLICVNAVLKLTLLLKNIEKKLLLMNSTLDTIKQSLVAGTKMNRLPSPLDLNTLSSSLIEGLKECSLSISQSFSVLKNLKVNCSLEIHYRKVMRRFREFDFTSIKLSACQLIANHVKHMMQNIFFLQSELELPIRDDIDSYFVTAVVYNCDVLLRSLQRLSNEVKNFGLEFYNEDSRYSELSHGFLFVKPLPEELRVNEGFNITSYIKEAARWRSFVTVKRIYKLMKDVLVDNIKRTDKIPENCTNRTSPLELNNKEKNLNNVGKNNKRIPVKLKKIAKLLRQKYSFLISDEGKYFEEILNEITAKNKGSPALNNMLQSLDVKNDKTIDFVEYSRIIQWNSDVRPVVGIVKEMYMKHLWDEVNVQLKNSFVVCFMDCCADDVLSFWYKVQADILKNCISKLLTDEIPDCSIEALSTLLATISCYHYLQQWDHGVCKAMGAMLKDKFRYSSENPGAPSSEMVNILIKNQTNQLTIHHYFKFMLQNEIFHYDSREYSTISFHNLIFLPLNIFLLVLKSCLSYKRQQFLISGCWEQFFVVASVDVKVIIQFFDHLVCEIKEDLGKKSESLNWIISHLTSECSVMKIFEEQSFRFFLKAIRCRSRNCFEEHMPTGKVWRRKGYSIQQQEVNLYVDVSINTIFPPLLGNIGCLSKQKAAETIQKCIKLFIKTWMEYILDNQVMFSWYGANQLRMDFEHFLRWFGRDHSSFSADEMRELVPASVVKEMGDAIMLLSCQPQGRRAFSSNLASSNPRMSTSTVSEVSVDTFSGNQFDQVILDIGLHDKERWLALRVKTNQSSKFLCIS